MSDRQYHGAITGYWPHAGIVLSVLLNLAGLMLGNDRLIETGANVLTISGWFLLQQRRNARRDD